VEVEGSTVRWTGFRNGYRNGNLSGLGPFFFDRSAHVAALRASSVLWRA